MSPTSYRACDPQRDPLACFIYPDIVAKVGMVFPPVATEAYLDSVVEPGSYAVRLAINPKAGGGRLRPLAPFFQRWYPSDRGLRMMGDSIETARTLDEMTATLREITPIGYRGTIVMPIMSGDGGASRLTDAVSRLPNNPFSVLPVAGVGTAQDLPGIAGGPHYTKRMGSALADSAQIKYVMQQSRSSLGVYRHPHTIATGIGGELFRVVDELNNKYPFLVKGKNAFAPFGVGTYLAAIPQIYRTVKSGTLTSHVRAIQNEKIVFEGETCGTITAVSPRIGAVTRIPGVDPVHGMARLLIMPERAPDAMGVIFEGMKWHLYSLFPGLRDQIPTSIHSLAAERQIALENGPVTLQFSNDVPMEADGDFLGVTREVVIGEPVSVAMTISRRSLLAELAGVSRGAVGVERALNLGQMGMIASAALMVFLPEVSEHDFKTISNVTMSLMVHGASMAVMMNNGSVLAFHLRLLNLAPAYLALSLGFRAANAHWKWTSGKSALFTEMYGPVAVLAAMRAMGWTPTVGSVFRGVASRLYVRAMGTAAAGVFQRSIFVRAAGGLYKLGYLGVLFAAATSWISDRGAKIKMVADWYGTILDGADSPKLQFLVNRQLDRLWMQLPSSPMPEVYEPLSKTNAMSEENLEVELRTEIGEDRWAIVDRTARTLCEMTHGRASRFLEVWDQRPLSGPEFMVNAQMRAGHLDPDKSRHEEGIFRAVREQLPDVLDIFDDPVSLSLAMIVARHRLSPPPPQPMPLLLAFLTSDKD